MRNVAQLALIVVFASGCTLGSGKPGTEAVDLKGSVSLGSVQLTVDLREKIGAISPYIYGTCMPDWGGHTKYLTLLRLGGNRTTAYNWENNASNAGNDYQNQSDAFMGGGDVPAEAVRAPVAAAFKAGAAVIVTVPAAGYVAADKNGGGDVNKTPNYLATRFEKTFARKNAPFSIDPDLTDHVVYEDEFVYSLMHRVAPDRNGLPLWFAIDNEPDLWGSTHSRIWTKAPTYDQFWNISRDYAEAIKAVDPDTLIFGPVSYGWNGYMTFQNAPDANGRIFLDYYLHQFADLEKQTGKRYLDVLDLHWYPEAHGDGARITDAKNTDGVKIARMQAYRSLFDPSYIEDSWISKSINGPIRLIPRVKEMIAKQYPGTKLGFTEWAYGGDADISGAAATADVLGVFGREGVFAATHWDLSSKVDFTYAGYAMYRNFDGKGGHFGDTAVSAKSGAEDQVSIYASTDTTDPSRVTVVVVNHTLEDHTAKLSFEGDPSFREVHEYQLTGVAPKPVEVSAPTFHASGMLLKLAGPSVTTLVFTK